MRFKSQEEVQGICGPKIITAGGIIWRIARFCWRMGFAGKARDRVGDSVRVFRRSVHTNFIEDTEWRFRGMIQGCEKS